MKKYKIGYTTGVFDMFHVGHLNIIREAKKQCEHLIVGVSTDEVVQTYKNKLPIIPYTDRAEIIKAIRYVDEVVAQTTMDKMEAWKKIKFNAMFHGDDWKGSSLYQKYIDDFFKVDVNVVFIPHTKGLLFTLICEKIKYK